MGKKGGKRKLGELAEEDIELEHEENELEAELKAVEAMRAEKAGIVAPEAGNVKSTYNKEGLINAAKTLTVNSLSFVESMHICKYDITINDDNDDLEREIAFYNQSLLAVKDAKAQLQSLGIAIRRPDDFFCENVKSDAHMIRVKDRLILEEKKIDAFEKRKQREVSRKYDKQVADMRKQEKSQRVKSEINEVTELRKGGQSSDPNAKRQKLNDVLSNTPGGKSKKRLIMDKKYGSGVKAGMKAKLNDKKSLNDFTDYNPRGGKSVRREKPKGGGGVGSWGGGKGGSGARGGAKGGSGGWGGGKGGAGGGGGSEGGRRGRSRDGGKGKGKPNRPGKESRSKARASRTA